MEEARPERPHISYDSTFMKSLGFSMYVIYACMLSHFSHVQLFAILWTVALQASLSMGILQARILEWVAMPFSRGSSQHRDGTCVSYVSCIGRRVLYH